MGNNVPSFFNLALLLGSKELALDEEFWAHACELRCAVPAIVTSFDSSKQCVTVQPAIMDTWLINLVPTPKALPPLANVPVLAYRGGGFSVTLPLRAGDEGVVFFSDMAIDSWWQSGGTQNPQVERRRHDLTDGMFYPGGWSQPRALSGYSSSKAQLRSDDGQTVVEVGSGEIMLTPDGGTTQVKATAAHVFITTDSSVSKLDVIPGIVNVVGVLQVNGVPVTVP